MDAYMASGECGLSQASTPDRRVIFPSRSNGTPSTVVGSSGRPVTAAERELVAGLPGAELGQQRRHLGLLLELLCVVREPDRGAHLLEVEVAARTQGQVLLER